MAYKINPFTGKLDRVSVSGADLSYSNPAYPSLTTIKGALDLLLYYTPIINTFTNNRNTLEIGTVVNSVDLAWALNKDKSFLSSLSINNGIGDVLPHTTGANGSLTHTSTFSTNRTYTLTMDDGDNITSKSSYVTFRKARYWGKISHNGVPTDAEILALTGAGVGSGKELIEQVPKTFDGMDMDGEYFIYAFPSSLGEAIFKIGGFSSGAFTLVRDDAFTNALGSTYDIKVYVSNDPKGVLDDFEALLKP